MSAMSWKRVHIGWGNNTGNQSEMQWMVGKQMVTKQGLGREKELVFRRAVMGRCRTVWKPGRRSRTLSNVNNMTSIPVPE